MEEKFKYGDIVNRKYPFEGKRSRISRIDRAAQFAPFAALTGFDDVIEETGRETEGESILTDEIIAMINAKLSFLETLLEAEPTVEITYFKPDKRKAGGMYLTYSGTLKEIDKVEGVLVMKDKLRFKLSDIRKIDSPVFPRLSFFRE